MIDTLIDTGLPTKICCRVLGVSGPDYYKYRNRPLSRTQMRHQWLTGLIREVHAASRSTYGSRRVHAELTHPMGVKVGERLVAVLMHNAGIAGLPGIAKAKRLRGVVTAGDLINRKFHLLSSNKLRVTDITDHPSAREQGLLLCRAQRLFEESSVGRSTCSTTRTSW